MYVLLLQIQRQNIIQKHHFLLDFSTQYFQFSHKQCGGVGIVGSEMMEIMPVKVNESQSLNQIHTLEDGWFHKSTDRHSCVVLRKELCMELTSACVTICPH